MLAGKLKEKIKILQVKVARNEYGEQYDTYTPICSTRANVFQRSGARMNDDNEIYYSYSKTFQVRSYVPVTEFDRIEYMGDRYRVLSINRQRRENCITIEAEKINE